MLKSRPLVAVCLVLFAPLAVAGPAAPTASIAPASSPEAISPQFKRGKLLFIQCRACHDVQAGQPDKVGPNLAGILGRKVAAQPGFGYSPALRAASFIWDRASLDRWLEKPSAVVPGNAMAFAGITEAKDRAALLTYLETATAR